MGKKQLKMVKQCAKCPWKVSTDPHDIPNGYCEAKHENLSGTIAKPGELNLNELRAMACHESKEGDEAYCIGWLMHQLGPGNNIGLRMRMLDYDLGKVQLRYTLLLIAWVFLMSYGLIKGTNAPYLLFPHDDKIIHVILFGVATILSMLASLREWKLTVNHAFLFTLVGGSLFACLSEIVQFYVPPRIPDWLDFLSNMIGLAVGMVCYYRLLNSRIIPGYR